MASMPGTRSTEAVCFVTIVDSGAWTAIIGEAMPAPPIEAAAYTAAGLPWFDYQTDERVLDRWARPGLRDAFERLHQIRTLDGRIGAPNVKSLGIRQVTEMRD
jgi:hypothetical protein